MSEKFKALDERVYVDAEKVKPVDGITCPAPSLAWDYGLRTVHLIDATANSYHPAAWPVSLASSSPVIRTTSPSAATVAPARSSPTPTMRSTVTCSPSIAGRPMWRCGRSDAAAGQTRAKGESDGGREGASRSG